MFKSKSIANRLILLIVSSVAIVFIIATTYLYNQSRAWLESQLEKYARNLVLVSTQRIDTSLSSIGKVVEGLVSSFETGEFSQNDTDALLYGTMMKNEDLFCIWKTYEPPSGEHHVRYYYRNNSRLTGGSGPPAEYLYEDAYRIPEILGKIEWSEPYNDIELNMLMTTCSAPFHRKNNLTGVVKGVIGADISLERLTEIVSGIKVLKTGYSMLISRNGTILTHPNKELVMNESIFSIAESENNPALREIGRRMIKGEEAFVSYTDTRGVRYRMYYAPIRSNGWSLVVFFPEQELFADVHAWSITIAAIGIISIVVLAAAVAFVIRSITTPLHELAEATEVIAMGNFDAELPRIDSQDEVGVLTRSFQAMNSSLKEYIRNLTETTAAKERFQSELRLASEIQAGHLPRHFPPFPDRHEFEIYASMDPAKEVGGDFYDFFLIDHQRLCFLIADVTDKGVPAALYMMVAKTLLKSEGERLGDPGQILSCVNNILAADNDNSMFATVFCAVLDTATGEVRFANAGHNPPVLISSGEARYILPKPGLVLGPMEDIQYDTESLILQIGDTLFLYTDGVTEASNLVQRQFGEHALLEALNSSRNAGPEEMVKFVRSSVVTHAGEASQSDDVTMLAVRYLGSK